MSGVDDDDIEGDDDMTAVDERIIGALGDLLDDIKIDGGGVQCVSLLAADRRDVTEVHRVAAKSVSLGRQRAMFVAAIYQIDALLK